ncbi:hypothetical protein GH880_30910, partial [Bacillus thuringiensis]|nr:hypothetical protein [Bacillus thuringiensis]
MIILVGIIVYGTFNILTIRGLGNEVLALNKELDTARKDPRLSAIDTNEKAASSIKEELSKLYTLDKYIDD